MHLYPSPADYHPISISVEATSAEDAGKLAAALARLTGQVQVQILPAPDPAFFHFGLMSHLHVTLLQEALTGLGASLAISAPDIAYREMISRSVEIDNIHKKIAGPVSHFARVMLRFEPNLPTMENMFVISPIPHGVPAEYAPGVAKGFDAVVSSGPMQGHPVVACKATLLDGAYHDVDSSLLAFELATRAAFRSEAVRAAMVLLEPIARVWVVAPESIVGQVTRELTSRRGQICDLTTRAGSRVIEALVPISDMFEFEQTLKNLDNVGFTSELAGLAELVREDDSAFRPAMGMRA